MPVQSLEKGWGSISKVQILLVIKEKGRNWKHQLQSDRWQWLIISRLPWKQAKLYHPLYVCHWLPSCWHWECESQQWRKVHAQGNRGVQSRSYFVGVPYVRPIDKVTTMKQKHIQDILPPAQTENPERNCWSTQIKKLLARRREIFYPVRITQPCHFWALLLSAMNWK